MEGLILLPLICCFFLVESYNYRPAEPKKFPQHTYDAGPAEGHEDIYDNIKNHNRIYRDIKVATTSERACYKHVVEPLARLADAEMESPKLSHIDDLKDIKKIAKRITEVERERKAEVKENVVYLSASNLN